MVQHAHVIPLRDAYGNNRDDSFKSQLPADWYGIPQEGFTTVLCALNVVVCLRATKELVTDYAFQPPTGKMRCCTSLQSIMSCEDAKREMHET